MKKYEDIWNIWCTNLWSSLSATHWSLGSGRERPGWQERWSEGRAVIQRGDRSDLKWHEVTWVITWNYDSFSGSTCFSVQHMWLFVLKLPKASGRIVPLGAAAKRRFLCCPRFSQLEKNPYNLKFYLQFLLLKNPCSALQLEVLLTIFTISFSICFFKLW